MNRLSSKDWLKVVIITLGSVVLSVVITLISFSFFGGVRIDGLITAIIVPLLVAPLASIPFYLLQSKLRVHREELQKTISRQTLLFSIIGHELRTPVSTIKMLVEEDSLSSDELKNQISEVSEGLLGVLDDLRIVLQPDFTSDLILENADPIAIINNVVITLSGIVKKNGMTLHSDLAQSDRKTFQILKKPLRQVVTNLIKNASIHSGGKNIYLRFEAEEFENGDAIAKLQIDDDGSGIPENLQEKVFKAFEQGDRQNAGSGLGLYIVKSIAEKMGGTLTYVDSNYGGSSFQLTFPMRLAKEEKEVNSNSENQELFRGVKVLLVEDNEMIKALTESLLVKKGAVMRSCDNGKQALNIYGEADFDLVLTDIQMPEMNGKELAEALLRIDESLPIIAVTATVDDDLRDELLEVGIQEVITKPVDINKLEALLAERQILSSS